jgi:hypothetical protein
MSTHCRGGVGDLFFSIPTMEGWVMHFHVYVDESGKLGKSDYTSSCGYVSHISEWQRFAQEWENCRFHWGVPPIHMAAIMFPERDKEWLEIQRKWGSQWERKRDEMLAELCMIVRHSHVNCVGAVVDSGHFKAMQDSEFKKAAKNPLYLAFHELVMSAIEETEKVSSEVEIGLILDDDQDYSIGCYRLLNDLKLQFPKVKKRIASMCFVDDRIYPGVQAADVIAYEARRLMVERKSNPEFPPSPLFVALTMDLSHQPRLYTAAILDTLEGNLRS